MQHRRSRPLGTMSTRFAGTRLPRSCGGIERLRADPWHPLTPPFRSAVAFALDHKFGVDERIGRKFAGFLYELRIDLQHMRAVLEANRVPEARRFVKELEQRWPEADRRACRTARPPDSPGPPTALVRPPEARKRRGRLSRRCSSW